jgi:hypothetical protein
MRETKTLLLQLTLMHIMTLVLAEVQFCIALFLTDFMEEENGHLVTVVSYWA